MNQVLDFYLQESEALRPPEDPDDLVRDDVDHLDAGEAGEGDEVAALVEGDVVVLEEVRLLQLLLHRHLAVEVIELLDLQTRRDSIVAYNQI